PARCYRPDAVIRGLRFGIILAAAAFIVSLCALVAARPDILVPLSPPEANAAAGNTAGTLPRMLWNAGMEEGNLDEWSADRGGGKFNTGAGDTRPSRDHAHGGQWSMKMTISGGEMAASRLFRWKEAREHRELYYS